MLRGILKLSKCSPIPALHFLLGELPIEGTLHLRTLSLFHNVWTNASTTVHEMVKYILTMCDENSTTWSNHIRILCLRYGLPSPLMLLNSTPWSKQSWKDLTVTRITAWHEREMRGLASQNSKMKYLNVQVTGLTGCPHPALHNISNTQDVAKLRSHLKFLIQDLVPRRVIEADESCMLCGITYIELHEHLLVSCRDQVLKDLRNRLIPELLNAVSLTYPNCAILCNDPTPSVLAQFVLDCTSLNLPVGYRVPANLPRINEIFRISRDWCHGTARETLRRYHSKQT